MIGDGNLLEFGVEELNVKKKFREKFKPLKMRLGFDEARKSLGGGGGGGGGDGVEMKDIGKGANVQPAAGLRPVSGTRDSDSSASASSSGVNVAKKKTDALAIKMEEVQL
jgi:hypothetical protein